MFLCGPANLWDMSERVFVKENCLSNLGISLIKPWHYDWNFLGTRFGALLVPCRMPNSLHGQMFKSDIWNLRSLLNQNLEQRYSPALPLKNVFANIPGIFFCKQSQKYFWLLHFFSKWSPTYFQKRYIFSADAPKNISKHCRRFLSAEVGVGPRPNTRLPSPAVSTTASIGTIHFSILDKDKRYQR